MKNQVIVITGAAGGIGSSCAYALKDYKLIVSDSVKEAVDTTVQKLLNDGFYAVGFPCDVTDRVSVNALKEFAKHQGEFKGIVHTAGVSGTVGNPRKVFNINLAGTEIVINAFYDIVQKGSVMILLGSMMGHTIEANAAYDSALRNPGKDNSFSVIEPFVKNDADLMYNFTKRGVLLLCKDNAMRFGRKGARIVTVSPGVILTPMAKKALEEHPDKMKEMEAVTPLGRSGYPEDIGNLVKFLISGSADFITGTDITIDGGVLSQILK
ncbi:MAG: SDR family oxidoreductase [Bacteroidetes bacterium]|nr:SDR family oxidoreductase [Bacteroidota bacterium]